MGFDLNAVINEGNKLLQMQGRYTPRRLNWYVFKAQARTLGGWGYDSTYWKSQLLTSGQRAHHWDSSYNLYKNLVVDEPSKSIFSKAVSTVTGAISGFVASGTPVGAVVGGGVGLFGGGGGVEPPPLLPTQPTTLQPQPILAGFQVPPKKILIGGAIALGFFSLLTVMRKS